MNESTRNGIAIGSEVMDDLLSQHPALDEATFSVIVGKMINTYANVFFPDEDHSEYFDIMADNIRLFATICRRDVSN